MAERDGPDFGAVLRLLREDARLTQEELAQAAGVSVRTVSDLERGVNRTARKATARLLAGPLRLTGQVRDEFLAAAGGLVPAAGVLAARAGAAGAGTKVRCSLPPDAAAFTGRDAELGLVTTAVLGAAEGGGTVAVHAICGMPGVGKTALAVHAAHVLAGDFPDRQFFLDLHAHTPGHEPLRAVDALAGLLSAAGVDPRFLPDDVEGRAAMWRDRMAGQRALLVLDNAASSSQVAPLLPGDQGCLVLVTSRRYLGDLPGAVTPVRLDTLRPEEAAELFTRLAARSAGSPELVAEVVRLAGYLPLAISLLARVYARHPSWTLGDLAGETRARLLTLTAETSSIAAAFDVSYRYLDPGRQRFFRLLGLHPGTTIDAYAAAVLTGISPDQAAAHLEALHGEGLVIETGYRRYGAHDLICRFACDLAAAEAPGDSQQALGRLLDYYQRTAALAEKRLARQTRPGREPAAPAGFEVPVLADAGRALAWARAERASLLACLDLVTRTGQHARVVALTAGLAAVLSRDGHWSEALARHAAAADAARNLGDRLSEANALTDLLTVLIMKQDYPGAAQVLAEALEIYRDLGSRLGEANALCFLGAIRCMTGDHPVAAQVLQDALGIYRDLGDQVGEAIVMGAFGIWRFCRGDYLSAARFFEQARGIYRDLGDWPGEAENLHNLGCVRQETGDYPGAAQALKEALSVYRDAGILAGEANALHELAIVRRRTGDYPGAAEVLGQARRIYRDLGCRHGEAHALRELGALRRLTHDHHGAAQAVDKALGICREFGDRGGEAETLNEQGTLHRVRGDLARARDCHQQALELALTIGSPHDEARALAGLGRCALTAGYLGEAGDLLRQAQQICQRIGAAETTDILTDISTLAHLESGQ